MMPFLVYLVRIGICWFALLNLLHQVYGTPAPSDTDLNHAYFATCGILTIFALIGWILRSAQSKSISFVTSGIVAFLPCLGAIYFTMVIGMVHGTPWAFFYKDDQSLGFLLLAPTAVGILSGILSLIPDSVTKDFEA